LVLAARVAVTVQVPAEVELSAPAEIEHPAVPALVTAKEYAPEPEPPDATRVRGVPYVPVVDVSVTADCAAWVTVSVAPDEVVADGSPPATVFVTMTL
jgi:hypothetical protein